MKNRNTIWLLTVNEAENESEHIASMMRNAGYPVRYVNVTEPTELSSALNQQNWDLVISSFSLSEINVSQVIDLVKQSKLDIPIIVTTDHYDTQLALNTFKAGARNYIPTADQELLLVTVIREIEDLENRRQIDILRNIYSESEKRNRALLNSSPNPIAYIHEGMHIHSNMAYLELFGYEDIDEISATPILDLVDAKDAQEFKTILHALNQGKNPNKEFEFIGIDSKGHAFSAAMTFTPACIDGENCTQVTINQQLTEQNNETIESNYNRKYFFDKLENIIDSVSDSGAESYGSLLHIELNDFDSIKEQTGIQGSELFLQEFHQYLGNYFNNQDLISQFSGSAFTIICPEKNIVTTKQIATTLLHDVKDYIFRIEAHTVTCSVSIGLCEINEKSSDLKNIFNQLDKALKGAKESQGDKIYSYTAEDEKVLNETDQRWVRLIKSGLENNQFRLVYQPIVSLHSEPGERYEVLSRLTDEKGHDAFPEEFIPAAAQAGLAHKIDRWVIANAAKSLLREVSSVNSRQFFINLSDDCIKDQTLLAWLCKIGKAAKLRQNCLVFGITETAILTKTKEAQFFIGGLKQLQCPFTIYNVGRDTDSFAYLEKLGPKYLKIEHSLIQDIHSNEHHRTVVNQITNISHEKGIFTIADQIQDATTVATLWQCGVNFIQGEYIKSPDESLTYDFSQAS